MSILIFDIDFAKFYVNKKRINVDKKCSNCQNHLWNQKKFCKIVDLLIPIDLFKKFQILKIVYILSWDLYKKHHIQLEKML